jgi:hypothetical protein
MGIVPETPAKKMVGTTGIEPVTTAMSRQCSTAELRAPIISNLTSTHQGRATYHKHRARARGEMPADYTDFTDKRARVKMPTDYTDFTD